MDYSASKDFEEACKLLADELDEAVGEPVDREWVRIVIADAREQIVGSSTWAEHPSASAIRAHLLAAKDLLDQWAARDKPMRAPDREKARSLLNASHQTRSDAKAAELWDEAMETISAYTEPIPTKIGTFKLLTKEAGWSIELLHSFNGWHVLFPPDQEQHSRRPDLLKRDVVMSVRNLFAELGQIPPQRKHFLMACRHLHQLVVGKWPGDRSYEAHWNTIKPPKKRGLK